jgi:hypothetical protein
LAQIRDLAVKPRHNTATRALLGELIGEKFMRLRLIVVPTTLRNPPVAR